MYGCTMYIVDIYLAIVPHSAYEGVHGGYIPCNSTPKCMGVHGGYMFTLGNIPAGSHSYLK